MSERGELLARVGAYYAAALERHGATARGVDWNSEESQRLRFDQLARLWADDAAEFSIVDYGCGCGALVPYLRERGARFRYTGFDIAPEMVAAGRRAYAGAGVDFVNEEAALQPADYVVASGIFNVKLGTAEEAWLAYMLETLERMAGLSRKGFAFNVLSTYSDPERRRADLFYADPLALFDHCKRRFARAVALLHDYPLYEFTLIVRK